MNTGNRFRSCDLKVMSLARCLCAIPVGYKTPDTLKSECQDPSYYIKDTRVIYMVKKRNRINFNEK